MGPRCHYFFFFSARSLFFYGLEHSRTHVQLAACSLFQTAACHCGLGWQATMLLVHACASVSCWPGQLLHLLPRNISGPCGTLAGRPAQLHRCAVGTGVSEKQPGGVTLIDAWIANAMEPTASNHAWNRPQRSNLIGPTGHGKPKPLIGYWMSYVATHATYFIYRFF